MPGIPMPGQLQAGATSARPSPRRIGMRRLHPSFWPGHSYARYSFARHPIALVRHMGMRRPPLPAVRASLCPASPCPSPNPARAGRKACPERNEVKLKETFNPCPECAEGFKHSTLNTSSPERSLRNPIHAMRWQFASVRISWT
jgi:hypothetical protein